MIEQSGQPMSSDRLGNAQLRAALHHVAIGIALVDLTGRMLNINPALARMIGYTAKELQGMHLKTFAHPEDAEIDVALFAELMEDNREHFQIEKRYVRKDRVVVWGRLTVSLLRNNSDAPPHALAMVEDITERKRAEEALEASEAKFRSLIENASDVVTILEADGTIRYESPAVERVLGYQADELEGQSLFGFVHPDDLSETEKRVREALQNPGQKIDYALRFRHSDGSFRWLEGVAVNLLDDSAVRGIVANSRDVTERVESERKLVASSKELEREHALFEQLFKSSPAAVVLTDPADRVLRINPAFTSLFGYTEAEMIGRGLGELIAPEPLQGESLALTWQTVEGERVEIETLRRRKDGSTLQVSVTGVPVQLHGDRIAVYGMYRDISTQKATEATLEQQATTDPLTGLLNRRGFRALLAKELERAKSTGRAPLLLYADLDDFKRVNDAYGHAEGDRVLRDVAEILKCSFRASDAIARLGGDEFAVLAADSEENSERLMRDRLHVALERLTEQTNRPYRVSMSLGALQIDAVNAVSPEEVLAESDRRMYEQKRGKAPAR